jgi:hypothetical protein
LATRLAALAAARAACLTILRLRRSSVSRLRISERITSLVRSSKRELIDDLAADLELPEVVDLFFLRIG